MNEKEFRAFAAKLVVADPDGCWLWNASHTPQGYTQFWCAHGGQAQPRVTTGHKAAYEHWIGPVPAGLVLDHEACDIRGCVNPWHLRPKTHRANILRGTGATARNAAKTHCPQGHPYDAENTLLTGGHRQCRICQREHNAATYRRSVPWAVQPPTGKRTHCPQGHPYDDTNTMRAKSGKRICRTCDNARSRAYHARKRQEVAAHA